MHLKNKTICIGRTFDGEPIGLRIEEESIKAYYGPVFLGLMKDDTLEIKRNLGRVKW